MQEQHGEQQFNPYQESEKDCPVCTQPLGSNKDCQRCLATKGSKPEGISSSPIYQETKKRILEKAKAKEKPKFKSALLSDEEQAEYDRLSSSERPDYIRRKISKLTKNPEQ